MSFLNVKPKSSNHFITIKKDRDLTLDFEDYTLKFHDSIGWEEFEKEEFLDICNYLGVKNPHNTLFTRIKYKSKPKYKPLHEFEWGNNPEEYGFKIRTLESPFSSVEDPNYVVHSILLADKEDYFYLMITHLPSGIVVFDTKEKDYDSSLKKCFEEIQERVKNES